MPIRPCLPAFALAALALLGSLALNPSSATAADTGTNPLEPLGGFSVVVAGDASLGNSEIEGSVAIGGNLTMTRTYAFIHSSGLTPTEYDLPVIDGDSTRVLIGGQFSAAGSVGVSEVSSRGNIRTDQLGYLKIADTSNLALNARGNQGLGVWVSAAGTSAGTEPALYVTDTVAEPQSSVAAPGAFASEFDGAFATMVDAGARMLDLASCAVANETTLSAGSHAGQRTIALVSGVTNYLNVSAGDLAFSEIVFTGAQPGVDTPVVFNVTDSPTTITIPRFAAANSTSATSPNPIAPYVLWNLSAVSNPITVVGDKVSGSIFAPANAVTLDASSPFEGQLVAGTLTTAGGEIHHYAFQGSVACLTAVTDPDTDTGTDPDTDTDTGTDPDTDTDTGTDSDPVADPTDIDTSTGNDSTTGTDTATENAELSTLAITGVNPGPALATSAGLLGIGILLLFVRRGSFRFAASRRR